MQFELTEEERRFEQELERFLALNHADDVMDANPEQLSQTVETPVKRRFMQRFERSYRYTVVDTIGGGTSEIQKNIIARRGLGLPKCF